MAKKTCIVLAAGDGKRLKTEKPKVLMEVAFEPMLVWVLDSVKASGIKRIGVIIGNNAELIEKRLEKYKCETFLQAERKGTGHAVMQAESLLRERQGDVLVVCGDAPFMDEETINGAYELHKSQGNAVTVITAETPAPTGYGRILRGKGDRVIGIIEEADCTDKQREITEVNSGAYWFNAGSLLDVLPKLDNDNKSGEYYLTDTVELLAERAGTGIGAYKTANGNVTLGANSRRALRLLNKIAAEMIIDSHLDNGVDIIGESSIIGRSAVIGKDTLIMPNTIIKGETVIGSGCVIGPNTLIDSCEIGKNVTLNNVQAYESVIEDNVKAGPFVHLRPKTVLGKDVKIGDFVEVKNSSIGEKTAIAHLTYIGDSDVGGGVNFGCGSVTANYDGVKKHRTVIGDNAFIGCNTNLIAPVKVGADATTAAGSTITRDVPDGSLAIERAQMNIKENWGRNYERKDK
ncbi:MAG: bifunctional UDP-N-acetylglucosamine diphosphorylase/glucosamine-1-phosphate N-acetyltransferase GlmU [Oscillospiraceae bacterium]|jgi:bifunctional UDP-N-acetylglucosamine pyrophosphorylase/glucosamine-1-phosphate N-acetyltransferase|nr:bifunctional UDP-N-acetylglucosamine diphosphorylase/glucosamine-1-phosphate N-acetyltransferase GlmU [Oscillospiraceae bacterium]